MNKPPDFHTLVALNEELQREVQGLRQSLQLRGVIERAKGVLMERHGITADEAFDRLRQASQSQNVRLAEVAAMVVGMTDPASAVGPAAELPLDLSPATSQAWSTLQRWPEVRAAAVGAIVESLASAAEDGDSAARLLTDIVGSDAALICAVREDAALEIVGAWGYPPAIASAWRRIPLSLGIALTSPARDGLPLFVSSGVEMERRFPASRGTLEGFGAWAALPVRDGLVVIGVIGLAWRSPRDFDDADRQRIAAMLDRPARLLVRDLGRRDPDPHLLSGLLRMSPDPWLVLAVAPGREPQPQHLIVESRSPDLPEALEGVRLLSSFPRLAADPELLEDLLRVLRDDTLLLHTLDPAERSGAPWDGTAGHLRAVRSGSNIVVTWRGRA